LGGGLNAEKKEFFPEEGGGKKADCPGNIEKRRTALKSREKGPFPAWGKESSLLDEKTPKN